MLTKTLLTPSLVIATIGVLLVCSSASNAEPVGWPDGAATAISLSYDDALNSQLDIAVPALERHGLRASFYVVVSSAAMQPRLDEWRALASKGHELGNHTLFHSCSGSLPDRDWVEPHRDIDTQSVEQVVQEVIAANVFLQAMDGETQRTFTAPCNDLLASGENYLPLVEEKFVAVKGHERGFAEGDNLLWAPVDVSGEELIAFVRDNTRDGVLLHLLFHGVGGDYLSVSADAHEALLQFLADNRDTYWVDTYRNIMLHAYGDSPTP